jgi:hypothetical protein
MTESLGQDGDARGLQSDATDRQTTHGGQVAPIQLAQASISVGQPAAGEEVVFQAAAGQRYTIDFNPDAARAAVQGDDLVLIFANGGRVVFQGMGEFAGDADAPVFEVAGQPISGGVIYAQTAAQSGAGGAPSLETAAAPDATAGTGETRYDDNTGNLIDLLNKQPGIPLTELFFRVPDLEPSEVFEEEQLAVTPGGLTPTVLAQSGSVDEDDIFFAPIGQEQGARISLAAITALGQQLGSDTLDLGSPFDPFGSQPTVLNGTINANFGTDVPGTIGFTPATISALEALGLTSSTNDQPLEYELSDGNRTLTARNGDEDVFTVALSPESSSGAFEYEFVLIGSINHPDGNGENIVNLPILFQVTDSTGDSANGSFGVSLVDDVPTIGFLPESRQAGELCIAESDIDSEGGASDSTTATIVFGADGPESSGEAPTPVSLALIAAFARADDGPGAETPLVYDLTGSGGTPLTSGGQIVQIEVNGLQITGFIDEGEGTTPVFTATLQEPFPGPIDGTHSANFDFELFAPLDHPDQGEVQFQDQIRFEFAVTVLDDDGDTDILPIVIDVKDDGPDAVNDSLTVAAGSTTTVGAAGVLTNDVFGADVGPPGGVVTGVVAGMGTPVAGNVGTAIAGQFGTLTLNADGSYTYVANGSSGGATAVIDFENLPAGTVLSSVATIHGPVTINGINPALAGNTAVIFDSANPHPSSDDFDLGTENQDFGGPGIGEGGEAGAEFENNTPHGNILIVAENLTDGNGDGRVDVPDDAITFGSILSFDFAGIGSTVTMEGMTIIDVEQSEAAAEVFFFDADGNQIGDPIGLPQVGNNGVADVSFGDISGVARMEIHLNGSGAIDNIAFRPDGEGGTDKFTYEIADADGDTDTATLTIDVSTGAIVSSTSSLFSTASAPAGETVLGTDGDDLLFGGDGDDELIGGLGNDTLFGGGGADRFVYDSSADEGSDEITDFSVLAGDTIELNDVLDPADGVVDGSFGKTDDTVSVALQGGTTLTIVDIDNMINTVDDLFNQNPVA